MAEAKHNASKLFLSTYNQATNPNIQKISDSRYIFKVEPYILQNEDPAHFVLGLEQISVPQSFYTFTTRNNTFNLLNVSLSTSTTITIPVGSYDVGDLVDFLSNEVSVFAAGGTIIYDYNTNKMSLRNFSGFTLRIQSAGTSTAYDQLGFAQTGETALNATIKQFTFMVNLTTTAGINIRLNNFITQNKAAKGDGGGSSILARVPITSGSFTWCQYFNPVVFYLTLSSRVINLFDIELLDDALQPIAFNIQNPNWFVVLKLDFINKEANPMPKTDIQKLRTGLPMPTSSLQNIPAPKPVDITAESK
jgi:hypothetical protein